MLEEIQRELEERLKELDEEADRLRGALAALGENATPAATGSSRRRGGAGATRSSRQPRSNSRGRGRARTSAAPSGNGRSSSGGTKGAVLTVLAGGNAMTASEVAAATGLGRASVSTTLSKLARSGEISKASRGYQLAS